LAWHGGILLIISRVADAANLLIGVVLIPRFVNADELGAVLPLTQLSLLFASPMGAVARAGLRAVALHQAREETAAAENVIGLMYRLAAMSSMLFLVLVVGVWDGIGERLALSSPVILILVVAVGMASCWRPVVAHLVQGLQLFYRYSFSILVETSTRLCLCAALLPLLHLKGYLLSLFVSSAVSLLFLHLGLRRWRQRVVVAGSYSDTLRRLWPDVYPLLIFYGVLAVQGVVEPWVIRQRLPAEESAAFYVLFKFGAIPTYVSSALVPFFLSMAASRVGTGKSTRRMHGFAMGATLSVGLLATIGAWCFGREVLGLYSAWRPYARFAAYLAPLTLSMALHAVLLLHAAHETAMGRYRFVKTLSVPVVLEVCLLYALMGWEFFADRLPGCVSLWLEELDPRRMVVVIAMMFLARLLCVMMGIVDTVMQRRRGV